MKVDKLLETAESVFAGMKMGGKRSDPNLAKLDCGVLTIALLVAAMDGTVRPEEYAMFLSLAKSCRGGSEKNVRALVDAALPAAGRLMAMAQVGIYTEEERLVAFLTEAKKALPRGFADGSMADVRRAFALWVTTGVADGEFSAVEKAAIHVLLRRLATIRAKKTKRPTAKAFALIEADFLAKAEGIARDMASASKRPKACEALEALVASMPTVGEDGKRGFCSASGVAVSGECG